MLQSQLFTKTQKTPPKDETAKSAKLLMQAGFIRKEMAGAYNYLPLGLRVLKKIENIIRDEMNEIGGQEILMSSLQRKELWERTGRWSDQNVDNWFKTKLRDGGEVGLGFTHEEPISNMLEQFVSSYQDLPFSVYQFQTKFRNEERAKSGILRTKEFLMKDLYSFSKDEHEHLVFYEKAMQAYKNIFDKLSIGDRTYLTYASGGVFSEFSHEFQTLADAGEDIVYINKQDYGQGTKMKEFHAAINKEIFTKDLTKKLGIEGDFEEKKAIEVGNIFTLGTRFSDPYLKFKNQDGREYPVFMGSYGIGLGRLMGTIVEVLSDKKGIVWPESVAPFEVHLLDLTPSLDPSPQGGGNKKKNSSPLVGEDKGGGAEAVYQGLRKAGIEVLWDDRDVSAGAKFADADLIGIPYRAVVSKKTGDKVELKKRSEQKTELIAPKELQALLKNK